MHLDGRGLELLSQVIILPAPHSPVKSAVLRKSCMKTLGQLFLLFAPGDTSADFTEVTRGNPENCLKREATG
jgi:hypothetical protein